MARAAGGRIVAGLGMAINFYDIAYGFGVGVSAPVWVVRSKTRRKVLDAFKQRMGHVGPPPGKQSVMLHAVSVGELNAARGLIDGLRKRHPDLHIIVSTTTQTGHERAEALYGQDAGVTLIYYPLDFSAAVTRVLDALQPIAVVLMELELWPNFLVACEARGIPVVLANGRITEGSFKNFRIGSFLTRRMFRRLKLTCVQEQTYADRFLALGSDPATTHVTGTMKFDTAAVDIDPAKPAALAAELCLSRPLWVAGSTGPGEEDIVLAAYESLRSEFPSLQLAIVPRKPERFNDVAALIESRGHVCVRRSTYKCDTHAVKMPAPVILGDTMGELRNFYANADVVFVGRTLVDLGEKQHGSDMIEPVALGKPTVVGPFTNNFAEAMNALRAAQGIVEITEPKQLTEATAALLRSPGSIGENGRQVVQTQRGATARTLELFEPILDKRLLAPSPGTPGEG